MNKKNIPTIDVIIPVYNGQDFIVAALKSVLTQTLQPTTIIIVNDGSTDSTASLLETFKQHCTIPIIIITQENAGLSNARNSGIRHVTAEYIAFLDADDVWKNNKLEKQIELFTTSNLENLGLVYSSYEIIDHQGNLIPSGYVLPFNKNLRGTIFNALLEGNKISGGSTALVKTEVLTTVGLFDETLRFGEDWDMWLRIAQQYTIDCSPDILVQIRRHGENMTHRITNVFKGELLFYKHWLNKITKEQIPSVWADKIAGRIIWRLPNTDFFTMTRKTIPSDSGMFSKTYNNITLYCLYFIVKTLYETLSSSKKRKAIIATMRRL